MNLDPDPLDGTVEPKRYRAEATPGYAASYKALKDAPLVPRRRPVPFTRRWFRYVRRTPTLWFLWSPVGRFLEGRLSGWKPWKDLTARGVWRDLDSLPDFRASIERGKADADAGRLYVWNHGASYPKDSWKPDDPIQPDGWHHDGSSWVRNES